MSRRGLIVVFLVALASFFYFALHLGYPAMLASLAGLAFGALAFAARRTLINLMALYSPSVAEED